MTRGVSDRNRLEAGIDAIRREVDSQDMSDDNKSRLAQLVAIWASGYLEATCRELLLEYARRRAHADVVGYVSWQLERFRSPNIGRMTEEVGKFDSRIAKELRQFSQGRMGESINIIVSMRHTVAHGRRPDMSLDRLLKHFDQAQKFAAKMEELLTSSPILPTPLPLPEDRA